MVVKTNGALLTPGVVSRKSSRQPCLQISAKAWILRSFRIFLPLSVQARTPIGRANVATSSSLKGRAVWRRPCLQEAADQRFQTRAWQLHELYRSRDSSRVQSTCMQVKEFKKQEVLQDKVAYTDFTDSLYISSVAGCIWPITGLPSAPAADQAAANWRVKRKSFVELLWSQ